MIFITGANGLLGSFIVRSFILHGESDIVALKRPSSDMSMVQDFKDKIHWVDGDVLDIMLLEEQTREAKLVVHCAGKVSFDRNDKEDLYKVNVEGTRNIVNVCLKNSVPRLIFVSSTAAFGHQNSNGAISESSKRSIAMMGSNYAITKYLAELEVWRGNMEGLSTFIVNPSVILGPGKWNSSSVKLFDYVWKENLFTIDGFLNFVDARDVAEVIYNLGKQNLGGQQFILNAERIAYHDFFIKIARQFKKRPPHIKVPHFILDILYVLDQARSFLTGRRSKVTREIKKAAKVSLQYNTAKIRELGFKFRPAEDTICWTCHLLANQARP